MSFYKMKKYSHVRAKKNWQTPSCFNYIMKFYLYRDCRIANQWRQETLPIPVIPTEGRQMFENRSRKQDWMQRLESHLSSSGERERKRSLSRKTRDKFLKATARWYSHLYRQTRPAYEKGPCNPDETGWNWVVIFSNVRSNKCSYIFPQPHHLNGRRNG